MESSMQPPFLYGTSTCIAKIKHPKAQKGGFKHSEVHACDPCRKNKKKCEWFPNPLVLVCRKCAERPNNFPPCEIQPNRIEPFQKWQDTDYVKVFNVDTKYASSWLTFVTHYPGLAGVALLLRCSPFQATHTNQIRLVTKDAHGWHYKETPAHCLESDKVDIQQYINTCAAVELMEGMQRNNPIGVMFRMAAAYRHNPIVQCCLHLYTSLKLMLRPVLLCDGHDTEMSGFRDEVGVPAPRMVKSQLGHLLEMNIMDLDRILRRYCQGQLPGNDPVTILVYFFLLHVRELDAARNIYWARYVDVGRCWQHPKRAPYLLEEVTASCKEVLSELRNQVGLNPANWPNCGTDEKATLWLRQLREAFIQHQWIPEPVAMAYQDGNPFSLEFTISSRMFTIAYDDFTIE